MKTFSLSQLNDILNENEFFVIDSKVESLHFKDTFKDKYVYSLDNPEQNKNFDELQKALNFFLSKSIKRNSTIVCIGGGATTDFGGFVASTILRGVKWISVPTTLLGMIDAGIGGKVGINSDYGKNLIGSFHLPTHVYTSIDFLSTLPEKEMASGKGELLKYAFLSKDIYNLVEACEPLELIIKECALYKMSVVDQDFKESGAREKLNYGHTFGHAIEKTLKLEHGLAIALGIYFNIKFFTPGLLDKFNQLAKTLEITLPKEVFINDLFFQYLEQDKKNTKKDLIRFIYIPQIGEFKKADLHIDDVKEELNKDEYQSYY